MDEDRSPNEEPETPPPDDAPEESLADTEPNLHEEGRALTDTWEDKFADRLGERKQTDD